MHCQLVGRSAPDEAQRGGHPVNPRRRVLIGAGLLFCAIHERAKPCDTSWLIQLRISKLNAQLGLRSPHHVADTPSPSSIERQLKNAWYRRRRSEFKPSAKRSQVSDGAVARAHEVTRGNLRASKDASTCQSPAFVHSPTCARLIYEIINCTERDVIKKFRLGNMIGSTVV